MKYWYNLLGTLKERPNQNQIINYLPFVTFLQYTTCSFFVAFLFLKEKKISNLIDKTTSFPSFFSIDVRLHLFFFFAFLQKLKNTENVENISWKSLNLCKTEFNIAILPIGNIKAETWFLRKLLCIKIRSSR